MEPNEPTVAELRAYLAQRIAEPGNGLQTDIVQSFVDMLDDYTKEHAAKAPTTAVYQRAPYGYRRRKTAAERVADDLNRRGVPVPETATGRFAAQMYELYHQFEEERRAEIIAAGGDPDEDAELDPLSREALVNLTRDHRSAMRPAADAQQYDDLIEEIADTYTLADVRVIRGAWAAITEAMPRIAYVARQDEGRSPDEIAKATGYTVSRIAQLIRQEKQRAAAVPLTQYTWRVDTLDADGWTDREHGDDEATPSGLAQLAERVLAETGARDKRARVFIWEGEEAGTEDDVAYAVERPAEWDAFVTVEQWDGADWRGLSDESVPKTVEEPEALASRILGVARERLPLAAVRVRVWHFGESDGPHLAQAVAVPPGVTVPDTE
ncbi:hypothetical protein [Streptomyces sp. NPDC094032]|uniref:hypothetical protein n=1 Tax=Streptomyces sp. NPDC094032 TaxID=3155308 RepID=UPI0033279CC8